VNDLSRWKPVSACGTRVATGFATMPTDLLKTLTYLSVHLTIGFSVAYWFTGSLGMAGGIALIEPCINAVAFFFHEKAWRGERPAWLQRLLARNRLAA
jgi:uncharacterized membrane protein